MAAYWRDLGGYLDTTLKSFFNSVREIPYLEDQEEEIIARPKYLLDRKKFAGLDCKKKSVLLGAYFNAHGMPWRLVTVSEKPNKEIHHIFPQVKIGDRWLNADATYSDYELFEAKPDVTRAQVMEQIK